jgi:heme-degrading monooxygenase HmoA
MFSVIFEVRPRPERFEEYLSLAKELKPLLERVEGFVDNERFESQCRPGWILSHSSWRDEKSVVRWRTQGRHHEVQERGRGEVFEDYHLRVGEVIFDSAPVPAAPIREQRLDETEVGEAKYATLTEITPEVGAAFDASPERLPAHLGLHLDSCGCTEYDIFSSIYTPGKLALLVCWRGRGDAETWAPRRFPGSKDVRHRVIRIVRDYGMLDRREAPQFFPEPTPRADTPEIP